MASRKASTISFKKSFDLLFINKWLQEKPQEKLQEKLHRKLQQLKTTRYVLLLYLFSSISSFHQNQQRNRMNQIDWINWGLFYGNSQSNQNQEIHAGQNVSLTATHEGTITVPPGIYPATIFMYNELAVATDGRSETNFSNYTRIKATAGVSVALLGDALSAGLKLEDKLIVNKCFRLVMSCGAMAGRGDVPYGGSLEATLRDKDYPLGGTTIQQSTK